MLCALNAPAGADPRLSSRASPALRHAPHAHTRVALRPSAGHALRTCYVPRRGPASSIAAACPDLLCCAHARPPHPRAVRMTSPARAPRLAAPPPPLPALTASRSLPHVVTTPGHALTCAAPLRHAPPFLAAPAARLRSPSRNPASTAARWRFPAAGSAPHWPHHPSRFALHRRPQATGLPLLQRPTVAAGAL
nr:atherin-like [Aegilops tauschii subsp. strangulata]